MGDAPRVLLIEDDPRCAGECRALLEGLGAEVTVRSTAKSGVVAMIGGGFDLVVCDHFLPLHDGDHPGPHGTYVYGDLRRVFDSETPFIHHSSDPCPAKYRGGADDPNFRWVRKGAGLAEAAKAFLSDA